MSGIKGERYIDENGNEVLTGGLKAAATIKERYGIEFYKNAGHIGGSAYHRKPRGFGANPALAKIAGKKGGKNSVRGEALSEELKEQIRAKIKEGMRIKDVAELLEISEASVMRHGKNEVKK